MSEIVYEETSKGVMQPRPSPHQRRKQREAEKRKAESRRNFWEGTLGVLGLLLAFGIWFVSAAIGFGKWWL